ncbi:MAG: FtsQ-type POTRA domain-containing protein [Candidatus Cloacimonetes bacterium]|nr:FtsQ-type POTRA domain-containing protein [Candidatus Cloacimonadota bacterium]
MNRSFASYSRARKPGQPWFSWVRFFLVLLLVFCLAQTWYIFYRSSWFALQEIEILGNRLLSEKRVLEVSGLVPGIRIFELDFDALRTRMLESEPLLQSVRILQLSPNRLQIRLEERRAVFWLKNDEEYLAVAADGVFLPLTADFQTPKVLIRLTEEERQKRVLSPRLLNLIRHWTGLLEHSSVSDYRYLSFEDRDQIKLVFQDIDIFIEETDSFHKHQDKILPFLKKVKMEGKQLRYIDIRFDNMVVKFG